ncbi:MAG: methyltransferase domain-containing protein [Patescibacteria group bacterium]
MKSLLHAGSGEKTYREIPVSFEPDEWKETRLDLDPELKPDVVGDITNMPQIATESFDAVFTSHTVEHLYPQEVHKAFDEFIRVLNSDGFVLIACPDLQAIASLVAEGKLLEEIYMSPEGPVTPLDMLYGFRKAIAEGKTYMTHKTGFTLPVLLYSLKSVGFKSVIGKRRIQDFELWAFASKKELSEAELTFAEQRYFPK